MDQIRTFFGPKLFRIYSENSQIGKNYEPNHAEKFGDSVHKSIKVMGRVVKWTLPLSLPFMYYKGMLTIIGIQQISKFGTLICISYIIGILLRGVGRMLNPDYIMFSRIFWETQTNFTIASRKNLSLFDYDVSYSMPDYDYKEKSNKVNERQVDMPAIENSSIVPRIFGYFAVNIFGRTIAYPGATGLINAMVAPMLLQGRTKLLEEKKGSRAVVKSIDGNKIDTMFVDRRKSGEHANGSTLVICCEGNAGFYEVGTMVTPLDAGYSVLGWNHPGFARSTGYCSPEAERNAVDAVFAYAIDKLGFYENEIVLFAWSIGGYTASYAAARHPNVKFVLLDATFDDVLPMALARMPKSFNSLVNTAVRNFLNLRIDHFLTKYHGPLTLIRRTKDEIITTHGPYNLWSNRGNDLFIKVLQSRYPNLMTDSIIKFVSRYINEREFEQIRIKENHFISEEKHYIECNLILKSYCDKNGYKFPCNYGSDCNDEEKKRISLFLITKYLKDFDSTHCNPLPDSFFQKPWHLISD